MIIGLSIGVFGGCLFAIYYLVRSERARSTVATTVQPILAAPVATTVQPVPAAPITMPAPAPVSVSTLAPPTQASPPAPPPTAWKYVTHEDPMTGKDTRTAFLISETIHQLDFPHRGGTPGVLHLRQHPREGLSVIVSIENGQLTCSFMNCRVMVRFDDRPPIKFGATKPADHSSKAFFLDPEKKFLKEIKNSSRMVIELTFFNQGTHAFEFNTTGLEWS